MGAEEYVFGSGKAPEWCARHMMFFRHADGSMGCEFHGYDKDYDLHAGDRIIRDGNKIIIRQQRGGGAY